MRLSFYSMCLIMIIILGTSSPVPAEIYQFTDENGEIHYTNDASSVPRQYRNNITIQSETIFYSDVYEDYEDEYAPSTDSDEEGSSTMLPTQGNLSEVEALRAQETAFDEEFKELQEERELLDEAMKKAHTKEELDEVNHATMEFNLRYKDFHRRRQTFKEEVKAYNEQVRLDMEQRLDQYKGQQSSPEEEEEEEDM